jgi:hypothetical protein
VKRAAAAAALAVVPVSVLVCLPDAADAAGPTCQSRPATVVGEPGKVLQGTSGPDVVVSGGASFVNTGDGDDVVCVTGATADGFRVRVDSGAGDDSVVTRTGNVVKAYLGPGEDSFVGGAESDEVEAGDPADDEFDTYEDDVPDTITTGGGDDHVLASQEDTIALGSGDDSLEWAGPAGRPYRGIADGGPGRNVLRVAAAVVDGEAPARWVLDSRAGTLSRADVTLVSWRRFTGFQVRVDPGVGRLVMRGSARDEWFSAYQLGLSGPPVTIRSGGGDDTISAGGVNTPGEVDLDIDGGPGRDLVRVLGYEFVRASLVLDLAAGEYRYHDEDSGSATVPLAGIEDADVEGVPEVSVRGDSSANRLTVWADQTRFPVFERCRVVVAGGGGNDRLTLRSRAVQPSWRKCPAPVVRGGAGNDVLVGSLLPEKLLGGPGRDVARGGRGSDTCVAETRRACERR